MASIGGFTVTSWPRGRLETTYLQVAALDPWPGVNGVAFVRGAYQTNPVECETATDVSQSRGDAELLESKYKALILTTVSVNDSVGRFWNSVMVRGVRTVVEWNGATGKYRLRANWLLHPLVEEPRS